MTCSSPVTAYRLYGESKLGFSPDDPRVIYSLKVPCGQCISCRLKAASAWATRLVHESKMHQVNAFATFTYKPEFLPEYGNLVPRDLELMIKRLRKSVEPVRIRHYSVGEYGEQLQRPHFHSLLFGYWPADARYWRKSASGEKLYRSASLEKVWPFGNVEVGEVTFQSAAYCARYAIKKINGVQSFEHYSILGPDGKPVIDQETGEVMMRHPEFARMSTHPGIGAGYVAKYGNQIIPGQDFVVINGRKMPVPKYYDRLLGRDYPERVAQLKEERRLRSLRAAPDLTPARLEVREEVAIARANLFKKDRY